MPSVKAMKEVYDTGEFKIYDEYNKEYTWDEFDERVLKFNGGVESAIEDEKLEDEKLPISHFKFSNGMYSHLYVKDKDGFEFSKGDFS